MSNTVLRGRFVMLGVLVLSACSPEGEGGDGENVDAEQLAATAIDNVERALRGTHRAGSFLADSQSVAESFGALGGGSESCDYPPCTPDGCPEPVCESETTTVEDLKEGRDSLDESIGSFVEALRDEIFTDANLESEDDDSVTFLLGPDTLCGSVDTQPVAPGEPPPASDSSSVDPDCAESIQKLQPRLRLTPAGDDGVDVALLLTQDRHNPVTLELHRERVAVVADLGEIKATLDSVGEDTGGLVSLDGKVSLELRKNAELDYSASANVLEDIVVVAEDDGDRVRVSLGRSVPTYEVRLDGNARTLSGGVDFGALSVSGPMNAFRDFFGDEEFDVNGNPLPPKTYAGDLELVVPGLEARAAYDGVADRLSFANFGLGDAPSTLKWNGITLAQVDLNAAVGRHFDIALESAATGGPLLTLSPTFDLSVLLNFMPVADQIDDLATYALGDTLRVWFDGSNPRIQLDDDQLRVVEGTLNMSAASAPAATVSVAAGQCLLEVDPPSASHELLGAFASGACTAP